MWVELTPAALAHRAGCHFTHLSRLDAGKRLSGERLVVALARALGLDEAGVDRLRLVAALGRQSADRPSTRVRPRAVCGDQAAVPTPRPTVHEPHRRHIAPEIASGAAVVPAPSVR